MFNVWTVIVKGDRSKSRYITSSMNFRDPIQFHNLLVFFFVMSITLMNIYFHSWPVDSK